MPIQLHFWGCWNRISPRSLRLSRENHLSSVLPTMTIRFLEPNDLTAYRDLRLAGLKESPTAFGSSYVDEVDLALTEFAARIRPHGKPDNGIYGAFIEGRGLVGILGFTREHRVKRT